nr:CHAT domain-containing protein [Methylorubrum extorquens]
MDQGPLNIGREANDLKAQIAAVRDAEIDVKIEHAWAIRADQIQSELLNFRPEIVHFSGHGDTGLLVFEDRDGNSYEIPGKTMADLIGLVGGVRCVVLNACYSDSMSKHIEPHVEAVIGCDVSVDDAAAAIFTRAFYRALAHGITFERGYSLARNELDLMGYKDEADKYCLTMRRQ